MHIYIYTHLIVVQLKDSDLGNLILSVSQLLDECLRAISGFKGTEDLNDDKLLGNPFTHDYVKVKTISSAPSYGPESQLVANDKHEACGSGSQQWCEAIEKQLSSTVFHSSAMVGYSGCHFLFYFLVNYMLIDMLLHF